MNQIRSIDGANITFTQQGSGDPVLLVHGGPTSGEAWAPVVPYLESRFLVVAMDRRGRGASTDGDGYTIDREAADIAAVIDAVGGSAHVVAHSSGARMALEAASRGTGIRSLVLYEPPLALERAPADLPDRLEELARGGASEAAADLFMTEIAATREEVKALKNVPPVWNRICASMGTVPREYRAILATPVDKDTVQQIDVPVLILVGEHTTSPIFLDGLERIEEALPDVRRVTIPGQRHMATAFTPEKFAEVVESFIVKVVAQPRCSSHR